MKHDIRVGRLLFTAGVGLVAYALACDKTYASCEAGCLLLGLGRGVRSFPPPGSVILERELVRVGGWG